MRKSFFLFSMLSFILIYSCDDGDVITFELDFEDTFDACEGVKDLVFYKTKEDPSESLSVLINDYSIAEILNSDFKDSTAATFFYRTYSDAELPSDLFCSDIPPKTNINLDEQSACYAVITTVLTEDDNDGISAELEKPENNPLLEGKEDFDGDGLDNYIDADDDGDNILTINENPDPNGDGILDDAQDTDEDGIPDYLDPDDDGDEVLTRDEETISQDNNPANDISNSDVGPDYLNKAVDDSFPASSYREHTILQTYVVSLKITGINLRSLLEESLDFGILLNIEGDESLSGSRKETPEFN